MLRGLGTVVVFVAFISLVFWAYNGKRKASFDEAAKLPFADEASQAKENAEEESRSNTP